MVIGIHETNEIGVTGRTDQSPVEIVQVVHNLRVRFTVERSQLDTLDFGSDSYSMKLL